MVPKKQLPRSPINAAGTIIIAADNKRFSPPKKGEIKNNIFFIIVLTALSLTMYKLFLTPSPIQ